MAQDEILLGAAGQMFSLTIPENGGFTETPTKFGATQTGISGTRTVDSQGARTDFTISWDDVDEAACSQLRQLYSMVRSSSRPVRLQIPHRKNLLTASASSGRSVARHRESVVHYQSLFGITAVTTPEVGRPDQDATYPLSPRLPRYTRLVNAGGDSDYVYPEGNPALPNGLPWTRIPVVEGRQYTLSLLYRRTVAGTPGTDTSLRWFHRREDGDGLGAPGATPLSLSDSDWTWRSVTVTIPTGWPAFVPVLEVGNGATVDVAAMQFEEGSSRTDWVLGSGVPVVVATALEFTDTLWPFRDAQMTLIEL